MTKAEPGIERPVSGDVLVSGVAEHHRSWRKRRRASVREVLADDALREFGKNKRSWLSQRLHVHNSEGKTYLRSSLSFL